MTNPPNVPAFVVETDYAELREMRLKRCETAIERLVESLKRYGVDSNEMELILQYIRRDF